MLYRTTLSQWGDPSALVAQTCSDPLDGCNEGYGWGGNVPVSSLFAGAYSLPAGQGLSVDASGVVTLTDYAQALANVEGLQAAVEAAGGSVPFDPATLDTAVVGQWWASGFALVVGFWIVSKSLGTVLQAIKRW